MGARNAVPQHKIDDAKKLRLQGLTLREIGVLYGVTKHTIYRWLNVELVRKRNLDSSYKHKRTPERRKRAYQQNIARRVTKEGWAKYKLERLRADCKRTGCALNLTEQDILAAIPADGLCPALKTNLLYNNAGRSPQSASIDKFIPALGYVSGNIHVISDKANRIKNDATTNELAAVAKWAADISARTAETNRQYN